MNHPATTREPEGGRRFIRRTTLRADEYRKNFRQLDADVIAAVTSREADEVTPLMSKIYLRLASAPPEFWEREGVLYFAAGDEAGRPVKASKVLYGLLGVASATAHKALRWMHEEGIIGYFAGKNGAGIRIFLNRAVGSIGVRADAAGKKILPFARGSNGGAHGSAAEPAFSDSFAVSEVLETSLNPRAPKSGADDTGLVKPSRRQDSDQVTFRPAIPHVTCGTPAPSASDNLTETLLARLEPAVRALAAQAATREHERTREWLESKGLPKAARVAQRETYNVLRQHGVVGATAARQHARDEVGRKGGAAAEARRLSPGELRELAETCVAMLEVHGQAIDVTLAELSAASGGILLAEDVPEVRGLAAELASGRGKEGQRVV